MSLKTRVGIRFFLTLAVVGGFVTFFIWRANEGSRLVRLATPIVAEDAPDVTIPITPNPVSRVNTAFQPTPDGKKKLWLKKTHNSDGTSSYVFTTTDSTGGDERQLYSTTLSELQSLSIPFNTWSPDDKYVFIAKNDGGVLLFNTTASEMAPGEPFWDIGSLFTAAGKKDTYKETTGWASETLLIINTTAPDGTKGSSYWFEVPSKAIIQLSSQF